MLKCHTVRLKESYPAKQDRGHGTRQFPRADAARPELAEAQARVGLQTGTETTAGQMARTDGRHARASLVGETRHGKSRLARYTFVALFLVQFAVVWVLLWATPPGSWQGHWPEAILLLTATAATLSSLARELPLQNVLLAGALIALVALGVESLNAAFGMPFGRIKFSPAAGPLLFGLPWYIPFVWVLALLTARGVARFLLTRLRINPNYGFYVLGLTVLLASAFHLSFQSFAVRVCHYWDWSSEPLLRGWVETPGLEWLSRAVMTLVIMTLVTPILIDKRPTAQRPHAFPLFLWLLLLLFFLTAAAVSRHWSLFSITLIQIVLLASLGWWYGFHSASTRFQHEVRDSG